MVMASSEFWAAAETVPLLCLGILFFGYRQISHVGPSIRERTDLIAAGVIVATIVVIGLNFLLIPRWGPFGAAVATATAFASEFVVVMLLSARIYPLGYPIARLLRPLLLAIVVYALVELSLPVEASLLTSLALKSLGLMVFGLAVVTWEGMLPSLRTAGSQALSHGRRSLRRGGMTSGGRTGLMWRRHDKWRLPGAVAVMGSQRQTYLPCRCRGPQTVAPELRDGSRCLRQRRG